MITLLNPQPDTAPLPLILPGSLEWLIAMEDVGLYPGWLEQVHKLSGEVAFVARPGSCGLLEAVSFEEYEEFCNDGEADARQAELDALWELTDRIDQGEVAWL